MLNDGAPILFFRNAYGLAKNVFESIRWNPAWIGRTASLASAPFDDFTGCEDHEESGADAKDVVEGFLFGDQVVVEEAPYAPPDADDAGGDGDSGRDFFPAFHSVEGFPDARVEVARVEFLHVRCFFFAVVVRVRAAFVVVAALVGAVFVVRLSRVRVRCGYFFRVFHRVGGGMVIFVGWASGFFFGV